MIRSIFYNPSALVQTLDFGPRLPLYACRRVSLVIAGCISCYSISDLTGQCGLPIVGSYTGQGRRQSGQMSSV